MREKMLCQPVIEFQKPRPRFLEEIKDRMMIQAVQFHETDPAEKPTVMAQQDGGFFAGVMPHDGIQIVVDPLKGIHHGTRKIFIDQHLVEYIIVVIGTAVIFQM